MAQWSPQREAEKAAKKKADEEKRIASILEERNELFNRFRNAGWEIRLLDPSKDRDDRAFLPDDYPSGDVHYLIKMPGAASSRVRAIASVYRLAKGATA